MKQSCRVLVQISPTSPPADFHLNQQPATRDSASSEFDAISHRSHRPITLNPQLSRIPTSTIFTSEISQPYPLFAPTFETDGRTKSLLLKHNLKNTHHSSGANSRQYPSPPNNSPHSRPLTHFPVLSSSMPACVVSHFRKHPNAHSLRFIILALRGSSLQLLPHPFDPSCCRIVRPKSLSHSFHTNVSIPAVSNTGWQPAP